MTVPFSKRTETKSVVTRIMVIPPGQSVVVLSRVLENLPAPVNVNARLGKKGSTKCGFAGAMKKTRPFAAVAFASEHQAE
jgi:hypothetical protein